MDEAESNNNVSVLSSFTDNKEYNTQEPQLISFHG